MRREDWGGVKDPNPEATVKDYYVTTAFASTKIGDLMCHHDPFDTSLFSTAKKPPSFPSF